MKNPVYAIATNVLSALGTDPNAHWSAFEQGRTGIEKHEDESFSKVPFYASKLSPAQLQVLQSQVHSKHVLSVFEQMALFSAKQAIDNCIQDLDPAQTLLVLSTTKGNIEWLNKVPDERTLLYTSATIMADYLGLKTKPVVVSQACVSGVVAMQYALRVLQKGHFKNAIVIGCDRLSKFVLNGFQSFHAIAASYCRPFDAARKGINLGEAAATVILSNQPQDAPLAQLLSGATSNDANHISGPSRTGDELAMAIERALNEAGLSAPDIEMVSAHGTATIYNDEMESRAFGLTALDKTPLHSLKGFTGHTLGAAGVLESVMIIESLQRQQLLPTLGYETNGVPVELNITTQVTEANIKHVLKTASGFGGTNATAIWSRVG